MKILQALQEFESVYLWVDPVVSGGIFISLLVTLLSVMYYSLVSVLAYSALFVLGSVAGVRLYVYIMVTLLSKQVNDPLKKFEEFDPTVSKDGLRDFSVQAAEYFNQSAVELRRLLFIDNLLDSLKFGLALWFLTYVGSCFNFVTMVLIAWVGLFTLPKIYLNNHKTLDPLLDQVKGLLGKVSSAVPAKARAEGVKKEE